MDSLWFRYSMWIWEEERYTNSSNTGLHERNTKSNMLIVRVIVGVKCNTVPETDWTMMEHSIHFSREVYLVLSRAYCIYSTQFFGFDKPVRFWTNIPLNHGNDVACLSCWPSRAVYFLSSWKIALMISTRAEVESHCQHKVSSFRSELIRDITWWILNLIFYRHSFWTIEKM